MASTFESLINNMLNVGIGAAATAAEKGQGGARRLERQGRAGAPRAAGARFCPFMQDIFTQAGGAFSDVTERLGAKGSTVAERILDELILARARTLTMSERVEFMAHVRDLVDSVDDATVTVEVEAQEPATDEAASVDAQDDAPADSVASAEAEDVE